MNQNKKAKVILIPTENNGSSLAISLINKELRLNKTVISWSSEYQAQQLLIISDDKNERIEDEDWYLNSLNGYTIHRKSKDSNLPLYGVRKIIASHPPLEIITISSSSNGKIIGSRKMKQPQPSQQFIEQYIESYNKGEVITDVLVEYISNLKVNSYHENGDPNKSDSYYILYPKINTDNTITIKQVKDSWNREEVKALIRNYREETWKLGNTVKVCEDWIKQNL